MLSADLKLFHVHMYAHFWLLFFIQTWQLGRDDYQTLKSTTRYGITN